MCARHCFLPSMMSWMPTSASQPVQFPGDVAVHLLAPAFAMAPAAFFAGQRRAEALDVVAQHVVNALSIGRRLFEQAQGTVENRRQVPAGEVRVGEKMPLDLLPR